MQLGRYWVHHLPRSEKGVFPVANVINSMSVWRRDAIRQIGPFNELLAVDHVDTEYCIRARQHGLFVYISGDYEFAHSIGVRRTYRLFGRTWQSNGHSAARRWMVGRGMAWLFRRYMFKEPAFAALCLLRLSYEAVGIAIAEGDRWAKLRALVFGTIEGVFTRQADSSHWPRI
jgi:rhamnosyltransferase